MDRPSRARPRPQLPEPAPKSRSLDASGEAKSLTGGGRRTLYQTPRQELDKCPLIPITFPFYRADLEGQMVKVLPLTTQPNSLAPNDSPSPSMGWGWALGSSPRSSSLCPLLKSCSIASGPFYDVLPVSTVRQSPLSI